MTEPAEIRLPPSGAMPVQSASLLRWLWFFLAPYKKTFISFSVFRIVRFFILTLLPLMIGFTINAFDDGWALREPGRIAGIVGGYMIMYGAALLSIFLFARESAMQDRMIRGMTLFSIAHMNKLPLSWHEAEASGGKMQRVMTARNSMKHLYNIYKWTLIPFAGTMVGVIASVIAIDAPFYFLFLYIGFMITFFTMAVIAGRNLPQLHDRHNKLLEKLLSGVYEFVSSVRTVRVFHMQDYIERRAHKAEGEAYHAMRGVFGAIFRKWFLLNLTGFFWMGLFVIFCMGGIFHGTMTTGAFATVFFLAFNMWTMLENMVFMQDEFYEHRNGFLRLTETLKAAPHDHDVPPLRPLPSPWRAVTFDNVSFAYNERGEQALRGITLSVQRGEKIALVGRSGAGKSTLVKLLMKQMLPQDGTIAVDGIDLRHIESGAWLQQTGTVPQDVELFNMSIRDNILLDRKDETDDAFYRQVLEQSALRAFIDTLPGGDETMVGERGLRLSGGQRQRLGIARALVRDAQLVIFDEATSALDSLSEQAIQQAIDTAFAGRTLVLIAHRLSTVRHVDRIIVLDDGKIIEEGSFESLLRQNGAFAQLWTLQSDSFGERTAAGT